MNGEFSIFDSGSNLRVLPWLGIQIRGENQPKQNRKKSPRFSMAMTIEAEVRTFRATALRLNQRREPNLSSRTPLGALG